MTKGQNVLKVFFKEVRHDLPAVEADRLVAGYMAGQNIELVLGQSVYGLRDKTAWGIRLTNSEAFRENGFPDATL